MRNYDWYKLINRADFLAEGLVSKNLQVNLEGVGIQDILVTKGNAVSILYDGTFLSLGVGGNNPFEFEDRAVYVDPDDDIWLGILNEN